MSQEKKEKERVGQDKEITKRRHIKGKTIKKGKEKIERRKRSMK